MVFDKSWFEELVDWYYEGEEDCTPISLLPCFGGIGQKEVRASYCTLINIKNKNFHLNI